MKFFFQYGLSVDVYSLTIVIFELFSGINPFPGPFSEIFQAKMSDQKPAMPSYFPSHLKELILLGWSKEPTKRPQLDDFKSVFNTMLKQEESTKISFLSSATKQHKIVETGHLKT